MVDWLVDAWACCRQVMYYWGEGGEAVGLGADVVAPPWVSLAPVSSFGNGVCRRFKQMGIASECQGQTKLKVCEMCVFL